MTIRPSSTSRVIVPSERTETGEGSGMAAECASRSDGAAGDAPA
jgi:hypothetical protein